MEIYTRKTIDKVKRLYGEYRKFLYNKVAELNCEISEIAAPENTPEARSRFKADMPKGDFKKINSGDKWGGEFCYAWIRSKYTVEKEFEGKKLLLRPDVGLVEGLLFLNGKASGIFDVCPDIPSDFRLHEVQPLTLDAKCGETFEIAIECYAGHKVLGTRPYENGEVDKWSFYPADFVRTFNSLDVVVCDETVAEFLTLHRTVAQILDCYDENTAQHAAAINAFCEIFKILPLLPSEVTFDLHSALEKANEILRGVTTRKSAEGEELGYVGLIGHSHLDTAWLWPVRETLHKAARTFSNALRLMEIYPDYRFMQSSVVYIDWMKKYYPDIYEDIKRRTAEGRWEPNGGAWVECDNNIPAGEYIIRQFLLGQRYMKENLGYMADCFWQPDTFGYSAAIPQILKGCGIKYFLTTKLSWNEANVFPHDSFIWKGIDGTQVLTHFNVTHLWPSVKDIKNNALKSIKHPEVSNMKLLSYGFGDGGGGPSYSMLESEKVVKDMAGMPKLESTTVSRFMKRLESTAKNLPIFSGELYLELHRGTLTQMHEIKQTNRNLEKAIHNFELLSVMTDSNDEELRDKTLKTLLTNQFHDILPGTCIADAHDVAIYENKKAIDDLISGMKSFFNEDKSVMSICNTLSFERNDQIILKNTDFIPDNSIVQEYTDVYGDKCRAVSGITMPAFSITPFKSGEAKTAECPFKVEGNKISTPFADIIMEKGRFVSYKTKRGLEVVSDANIPLNTLYFGEDIPEVWDNWDIDYDQAQKIREVPEFVSSEVVSIGALQLRIRVKYKFDNSTLSQDIIFYSDNPRIDFQTVVDWNSPHSLLKVGFKVNVLAGEARFETQFGNIKRPTHENYPTDKTQFEVCNHKWTDLSDTRFGVSLLNDCKYGISVNENDMRLTLHKGGCRPDPRGDKGVHKFTYSLLVHETAFSSGAVIKPAYELNYPVLVFNGSVNSDNSKSLLSVDADNVIIETVKPAEDGNGFIARIYETEGSYTICNLEFDSKLKSVFKTDMLEYEDEAIDTENNSIKLDFKPFEIKTLRFIK
ncbi:MAG: glycoside hydrolase family 38 C-terminal domain-containing protein [Oscillospiraceae bacterium]|nr:glycoside hydrolase family 38 C-terminal domain-containing protein [Oscillospiraceae bacterium]